MKGRMPGSWRSLPVTQSVVDSNGRAKAVPANAIAMADENGAINLHPKTFGMGQLA